MRTSIFRLTQEGWLTSNRVGRRSYYSLTDSGHKKFERAFRRVYRKPRDTWSGDWCFLLINELDTDDRKRLLDQLSWQGFGMLTNNLLASPNAGMDDMAALVQELEIADRVVPFVSQQYGEPGGVALENRLRDSWNLEQLAEQYRLFTELFAPLETELDNKTRIDPQSAFLARTLLIHEYRKLVLRDPQLPPQLLPEDWEGHAARALTESLYRKISPAAERWILDSMETEQGELPPADVGFSKRFGGL